MHVVYEKLAIVDECLVYHCCREVNVPSTRPTPVIHKRRSIPRILVRTFVTGDIAKMLKNATFFCL